MTKFIIKFFLIISLCTCAFAQNSAENSPNLQKVTQKSTPNKDANTTQKQIPILTEANLTEANLTQPKDEDDEISKEIKKAQIIQNLKEIADVNESDELVQIIADKIADGNKTIFADNNKTKMLREIIYQIRDLNSQIFILNSQTDPGYDTNATQKDIAALKTRKDELLNQVPVAITHQLVDENIVLTHLQEKKELTELLAKHKKHPKSDIYIQNSIKLYQMELSEISYGTLIKIEKKFSDGVAQNEIATEIQNVLFSIRTDNYTKFQELQSSMNDEAKSKFEKELQSYIVLKQTYEDIFNYLLNNQKAFASNAIFTNLKLKDVIDKINKKSPFDIHTVNSGKLVLILLITFFAFSLRKFLANIIFFFIKLFFKNKEDQTSIKEEVIDIIKKPLGFLLIGFAFGLSATIFYYPSPVPIKFSETLNVVYVILYAWLVTEIISGYGVILVSNIVKKGGRKEVLNLMLKIVHIIVIVIAILLILTHLGFNVSTIVASLGIGGLAVALATKDIIANFFASVMLIFDNSFSQGDWIVIGDIQGTIVETGLRKTTIRTFDNSLVFIPNSRILDSNIKNWNRRRMGRNIEITIGVEYGTPAEKIVKCMDEIREMLQNHQDIAKPRKTSDDDGILRGFRHKQNIVSVDDLMGYKSYLFVALKGFGDSSIDIWVYCFTKTTVWGNYLAVKQDILLKMMKILEENNVNFAFPSQSLYIEKMPN